MENQSLTEARRTYRQQYAAENPYRSTSQPRPAAAIAEEVAGPLVRRIAADLFADHATGAEQYMLRCVMNHDVRDWEIVPATRRWIEGGCPSLSKYF